MDTQTIDLSKYEVILKRHKRNETTKEIELVDDPQTIDPKEILYNFMRAPGVFKNGTEIVESIMIARSIRDAGDKIALKQSDLDIVKKVLNHFISKPHNPQMNQFALGGEEYEELIMRIFS